MHDDYDADDVRMGAVYIDTMQMGYSNQLALIGDGGLGCRFSCLPDRSV